MNSTAALLRWCTSIRDRVNPRRLWYRTLSKKTMTNMNRTSNGYSKLGKTLRECSPLTSDFAIEPSVFGSASGSGRNQNELVVGYPTQAVFAMSGDHAFALPEGAWGFSPTNSGTWKEGL